MDAPTREQAMSLDELTLFMGENNLGLAEMLVHVAQPAHRILLGERTEGHVGNTMVRRIESPTIGVEITAGNADNQFSREPPQILSLDTGPRAQDEASTPGVPPAQTVVPAELAQ